VTNEAVVSGFFGCEEVSDSDSVWVEVECPPEQDRIIINKWVKPDSLDPLYDTHIMFDYGEYSYVTYRLDIQVNEAFTQSIYNVKVRDNLPQIHGLIYENSYVRDQYNHPYTKYTFSRNEKYLFWNFTESLSPGEKLSIYYCGIVNSCGTFKNWANITGDYFDGGPCCPVTVQDGDYAIVNVNCAPYIEVIKEASFDGKTWSKNSIKSFVDDVLWFRLTIKNSGLETAEGINVFDYLPDFLKFKKMIDDGGANVVDTTGDHQIYDLRWFFTELEVGDTIQIIYMVDVISIGTGYNNVKVTSCDGIEGGDNILVEVTEGIFVQKTVSKNQKDWFENITASTGEIITWNITVSFHSYESNHILHHISIWDKFSKYLSYVDDSSRLHNPNGTITFQEPNKHGNVLKWEYNFMQSGDTLSVTFKTKVNMDAEGELENYVNVTGKICDGTVYELSDSAHVYVPPAPKIQCEKLLRENTNSPWVNELTVDVGDNIYFNITFENQGRRSLSEIDVFDDLPINMEYVDFSSELLFKGSVYDCEPDSKIQNILWNDICSCIPTTTYLDPGESFNLHFRIKVTEPGEVTNRAKVNATVYNQGVRLECSDTAFVHVNVEPLMANAGTTYTAFVNDELQLYGSATGGIPPYEYYWDLDGDGDFDDSSLEEPTKTWAIAGTYTVSLKVVDNGDQEDTDSAQITIKNRLANLYCMGSITWDDVKRKSTQTATFTLQNTGDPKSKLDWSIQSSPSWGEWTIEPSSGTDITPEDGKQTIQVTVVAPKKRNTEYNGSIIVQNDGDASDTGEITISLKTSRVREYNPLQTFIDYLLDRLPILEKILGFFYV
jgi:fimbrial isopeptide formation D2 family protein/uncharacterized repeat protein (TIGR01451 family)